MGVAVVDRASSVFSAGGTPTTPAEANETTMFRGIEKTRNRLFTEVGLK